MIKYLSFYCLFFLFICMKILTPISTKYRYRVKQIPFFSFYGRDLWVIRSFSDGFLMYMLLNTVTEHHLYTHHTQNLENIIFIKSIFFLASIDYYYLFVIQSKLQIVVLEIDKKWCLKLGIFQISIFMKNRLNIFRCVKLPIYRLSNWTKFSIFISLISWSDLLPI